MDLRVAADGIKRVNRPANLPAERVAYIDYIENNIEEAAKAAFSLAENDFITFDTETSCLEPMSEHWKKDHGEGFVYMAQFYINGMCFLLRTIEEAIELFRRIGEYYEENDKTCVVYVHNLSYEWQFLKAGMITYLGAEEKKSGKGCHNVKKPSPIFAMSKRKILHIKFFHGHLVFRCSYLLSNMSLEKFTENYCTEEFRKDKDGIDYQIVRYPWSELDDAMLYYGLMDVLSLHEAICTMMQRESRTLSTIPLTSTGWVRQHTYDDCIGKNPNRLKYEKIITEGGKVDGKLMPYSVIELMERAFRGGDTHASRFKVGNIYCNVGSYDFASSYPYEIICSKEFPIGQLHNVTMLLQSYSVEQLKEFSKQYWVLIELEFDGIELRDPLHTHVPYLPASKCEGIGNNYKNDNGRVMYTESRFRFCCLGIELDLLFHQYEGDFRILQAYAAEKGTLPIELRESVFYWYENKTSLKGIEEQLYEYMKAKNMVNSEYGMMVEHPLHTIFELCDDGTLIERPPTEEEKEECVRNYFNKRKKVVNYDKSCKNRSIGEEVLALIHFLLYSWGITITACARLHLHEMIDLCGDDFIYCDTDSVKMEHPEAYTKTFEKYNNEHIRKLQGSDVPYYALTKNGEKQVLGIADFEGTYERFVTLGAKKYAYEKKDKNGNVKLGITVSGVPKEAGAIVLGKLENFIQKDENGKYNFVFHVGNDAPLELRQKWKKALSYNDSLDTEIVVIDGHELRISSNVYMSLADYTLSIPDYYDEIVEEAQEEFLMGIEPIDME